MSAQEQISRSGSPVVPVDWRVIFLPEVDSTQRVAVALPAWSAVMAESQTGGRGQWARAFVSDPGGLYLTAVVPFDGDASHWRGFALAVGRAVLDSLRGVGVDGLRLRWPNDLMIGSRKVGGILIEQGCSHTLLVGLGLNITNQPWLADQTLQEVAARLLDHCDRALTGPAQLLEPVLQAIRRAHEEFAVQRLGGLVTEINLCWGGRREVRLESAAGIDLPARAGSFAGIDKAGWVLLVQSDGSVVGVPDHHILRLVEVE